MNRKFLSLSIILLAFFIVFTSGCKPTTSEQPKGIEGIYYFEITWKPHGWSFLRFYSDGTVINNNTNFGDTPQEAWGDIQGLLTLERANDNWHGKYQLDSDRLVFTLYKPDSYPTQDPVKSECKLMEDRIVIIKINDADYDMEYLLLQP